MRYVEWENHGFHEVSYFEECPELISPILIGHRDDPGSHYRPRDQYRSVESRSRVLPVLLKRRQLLDRTRQRSELDILQRGERR